MKKDICFILLFLFVTVSSAFAQLIGFESSEVPEAFKTSGKGEAKISSLFYKEGKSSLEWDFQSGSTLNVQIPPLSLKGKTERQYGITLWIYNEKPQQDSIRFEFLNKAGEVSYWFAYHLQAAGWRACWISFEYMQGDKKDKDIVAYRLVAPQRKGRIFLDRLIFPEKKMNLRTTPDQQLPTNNGLANRNLWHWCLVWKWEQLSYDTPLASKLTARQAKDLKTIEQRLTDFLEKELGLKHLPYMRGYKNVINEAIRLNEAGETCLLAMETSGHGALKENYFLDDGAYLATKIVIRYAQLRRQGRTLADLLEGMREPLEARELRFRLLPEDFKAAGAAVLAALERYAASQPGWVPAPHNYEGLRYSVPAVKGWFLLRMSLHDPLMPLNIESDCPGGSNAILRELTPFLTAQPALDTAALGHNG